MVPIALTYPTTILELNPAEFHQNFDEFLKLCIINLVGGKKEPIIPSYITNPSISVAQAQPIKRQI